MKKVSFLFETSIFDGFFGKYRSKCALYFLENALASPYLNIKKKIYLRQTCFYRFLGLRSQKKKEKQNQETESQDHVRVHPRKGKIILNWTSKFLRYSVPQIHSYYSLNFSWYIFRTIKQCTKIHEFHTYSLLVTTNLCSKSKSYKVIPQSKTLIFKSNFMKGFWEIRIF